MNKEEKVKEYYRNCYPSNINYSSKVRDENGNKNDLYFRELTIQLYNLWNNEVNQNITFSEETKKYLKIENRQLHYLFNDIFKLFYRVCVFEETPTGEVKSINPIFRAEYDIEKCFSNIDFHSLFISTLIENSQLKEAIAVKGYLLTRIKTVITNSKQLFGISLLKSPLAEYFTNYISSLKEAINTDEIKLSIELEEPKEKQPIKEGPKQDKIKVVLINQIEEAEALAKETEKIAIEQDLFSLKNKMLNDNHYTLLLNEYHTNNINSYNNIENIYKASKEQFYFLQSKTKNTSNSYRLDFIAMNLLRYLNWKPNTEDGFKNQLNVIRQIKDIDNIVYETYLAELKNDYSKKYLLNEIQTKKEPQQEKKELQLNEILTCESVEAEKIVNGIKTKYKNIKGKQLKLLFLALQNLDLIPKEQFAKKFYDCCTKEFNWNVASYNAMNGYKYNEETDKEELNAKIDYLKTFINS
ncbi:hypothetical protein [Tenacibaculum piscium]|uniref:hypothetical protein n=1 Tax=Tenacibaculum piscium TaxID=1458515 RepID=UPI00187BA108|nr:hypothetical protein [Tenacibaculum piscium]MBE7689453.1 hypothetical protein [Tenacibaculum piscium]